MLNFKLLKSGGFWYTIKIIFRSFSSIREGENSKLPTEMGESFQIIILLVFGIVQNYKYQTS